MCLFAMTVSVWGEGLGYKIRSPSLIPADINHLAGRKKSIQYRTLGPLTCDTMIFFYPRPDSVFSNDVAEKLQEMVLAHRIIPADTAGDASLAAAGMAERPALREGERWVVGEAGIRRYLDELEREVRLSRLFQSDVCIMDPDTGEIC
jgi:hypothetical protein